MKFAIDYDETITEYRPFPINAPFQPEALAFIKQAYEQGHTLYLWTSRTEPYYSEAIERLKQVDYWKYFSPISEKTPTGKITVDYYIDDRATPTGKVDWFEWLSLLRKVRND